MKRKRLHKLDFGLTTKCNAGCPQCPRTDREKDRHYSWLKQEELTVDNIKTIVPPQFFKDNRILDISFCGGYGDPLMAKDVIEIIDYFHEVVPTTNLYIATNGSMKKNPQFWHDLGKALSRFKKTEVTFAIDGIDQESHVIYRKKTDFNLVLEHAQILKMYGVTIIWQFIVFEHNKHMLEQAEEMSKEYKFDRFSPILSNRQDFDIFQIPVDMVNKIPETRGAEFNFRHNKEFETISCITDLSYEVHIPANGFVTPCCFLDERYFLSRYTEEVAREKFGDISNVPKNHPALQDIETLYGDVDINIFNTIEHGLEAVLDYEWWDQFRKDRDDLKINKCNDVCGKCKTKKEIKNGIRIPIHRS